MREILSAVALLTISCGDAFGAPEQCPSEAMPQQIAGQLSNIRWKEVGSDGQATACLREVALKLSPSDVKVWLERNGFVGVIATNGRGLAVDPIRATYLNAAWPIRRKGVLYSTGFFSDILISHVVYAQSFAFLFDQDGDVRVREGKTSE